VQTRDHGRGAIVDVAQGNDQCVQRKDHSGHGGDGGGDLLPPRHRLVDLWTGQGEQEREIRKRKGRRHSQSSVTAKAIRHDAEGDRDALAVEELLVRRRVGHGEKDAR
jgi:hypothetical protein